MRRAATDEELASRIAAWFRKELAQEVKPEEIRCDWCRGDREMHWSADCWILQCCVDGKGLAYCHECNDFPCGRLEEWAAKNERYGEALQRLKKMKRDAMH
jgi:hypothetical protein